MYQLNARVGVGDAEALSVYDAAIHLRMQIREAAGELDLFSIHLDAAVGAAAAVAGLFGQVVALEGEEPAHIGVGKLELAGHAARLAERHRAVPHITKPPQQQIKEMHADVGGNTAGFFGVAFPAVIVPETAGGDVGQLDLIAMRS